MLVREVTVIIGDGAGIVQRTTRIKQGEESVAGNEIVLPRCIKHRLKLIGVTRITQEDKRQGHLAVGEVSFVHRIRPQRTDVIIYLVDDPDIQTEFMQRLALCCAYLARLHRQSDTDRRDRRACF